MEILLGVFISTTLFKKSASLTLQCEYKVRQFTWKESLIEDYGCKAAIVLDGEKKFITSVSQNHMEKQSFDDVRLLFYAHEQIIPALPKFGFKFFPKLEAFSASKVSLENISSRDFLKAPPSLRIVFLYGNKLREIPSDLFKYTPNIEVLALNGNQIAHIGNNFIDSLNFKSIQKFGIFENTCTDFKLIEGVDKAKLDELKVELKEKCQPTQEMIAVEAEEANRITKDINK